MPDPFKIQSSERGVVRVFTTDLDSEGSSAITPENVHRLLGDGLNLDSSRIEVFPSTVLDVMGLSTYLVEGYGIPKADLQGQAAALDALKGLVILVSSSAFKGQAVELDPKSGIRFVGLFSEPVPAPPEKMDAPKAAEGTISGGYRSMPLDTRSGRMWPLALIILLAAAALVLLLVF
jgi:hypothetical protein